MHFNTPTNEAIVARLIKEVKASNPQFQEADIRGKSTVLLIGNFTNECEQGLIDLKGSIP